MKPTFVAAAVALLGFAAPTFAHVLDEYLQATTVSVEKDRITVRLRLIPGVDVSRAILPTIDADGNGMLSPTEQRAYAQRVLGDLSLTIDGERRQLRLVSWAYPGMDEMKEGTGAIVLVFDAEVLRGGVNRRLVFENHHYSRIAAYLVNCLASSDPDIHIIGQNRNYEQSSYQLDYAQMPGRAARAPQRQPAAFHVWAGAGAGAIALIACLAFLRQRRRARSRLG